VRCGRHGAKRRTPEDKVVATEFYQVGKIRMSAGELLESNACVIERLSREKLGKMLSQVCFEGLKI